MAAKKQLQRRRSKFPREFAESCARRSETTIGAHR